MIFNAHPRLYWGEYGANADHAWLQIGGNQERGFVRVGSVEIPTTGVLGHWRDANGNISTRAFPGWATIPIRLRPCRRARLAFRCSPGCWSFPACSPIWLCEPPQPPRPARPRAHGRRSWRRGISGRTSRTTPGCASPPARRRATTTCCRSQLSRRDLRPAAADRADRAHHVAGDGRGLAAGCSTSSGGRQSARSIHFICAMP